MRALRICQVCIKAKCALSAESLGFLLVRLIRDSEDVCISNTKYEKTVNSFCDGAMAAVGFHTTHNIRTY